MPYPSSQSFPVSRCYAITGQWECLSLVPRPSYHLDVDCFEFAFTMIWKQVNDKKWGRPGSNQGYVKGGCMPDWHCMQTFSMLLVTVCYDVQGRHPTTTRAALILLGIYCIAGDIGGLKLWWFCPKLTEKKYLWNLNLAVVSQVHSSGSVVVSCLRYLNKAMGSQIYEK